MSYIAFDLDALNVVPDAARAAGVSQGDLAHGLLKLWAWCFRSEKTEVSSTHLAGFFGGEVGASLEAFGFLERVTDGWRVRGAERYLRIKDARRRGAESTNAARAERSRSVKGANAQSRSRASVSDAGATLNRTLNDALTPSTEHRAPNTTEDPAAARPALELVGTPEKPKRTKKPEPTGDPRHQALVVGLCEAFEGVRGVKYPFASRDAASVKRLLQTGTDPLAIVDAWKRALRHQGFPSVSTLHDLADRLATFLGTGPPSTTAPKSSLPAPSSSYRTDGPVTAKSLRTF